MPQDGRARALLRRVLKKLLDEAEAISRPQIPSKQLQAQLEQIIKDDGIGFLSISAYWAVYVHDGRAAFGPRSPPLIWFRDPNNDPRLINGVTPDRAADLRHLSSSEFRFWARANAITKREGRPLPMIISESIKKDTIGSFFWDNEVGMIGFVDTADGIVAPEWDAYRNTVMADLFKVRIGKKAVGLIKQKRS